MLSGNRSIYWPAWRLILRRRMQQAKNLLPFVPIALKKKKKKLKMDILWWWGCRYSLSMKHFSFFCQDNFTKRFPTYQDWNARQDKCVAMSDLAAHSLLAYPHLGTTFDLLVPTSGTLNCLVQINTNNLIAPEFIVAQDHKKHKFSTVTRFPL